jgi:AmmeMemoRadiSam system protein B
LSSSASGTRPAAVAGQFYPSDKDELFETIHWSFTHPIGPGRFPTKNQISSKMERVECLIVPHAGYIYSGPVAAHSYLIARDFFLTFQNRDQINIIILGPNHYGVGSGVALSPSDYWETPLGKLKMNSILRKRLSEKSSIIDLDALSHSREHSIEVQLPFLQVVGGATIGHTSFLPISLMLQDLETTKEIAEELTEIIQESDEPFLVLGSSDLTHYETAKRASAKDGKLLEEVKTMNPAAFYNSLQRLNVSACGYGAISTVMQISKLLGKKTGRVLKYATSGDTSGDVSSVVGYSSVHFT